MIGRKRRGLEEHSHVSHERWLVSYADFVTLLFALFVVLFSISQVDEQKLGRFSEAIREVTHAQPPPPPPTRHVPGPPAPSGDIDAQPNPNVGQGPVPGATGTPAQLVPSGLLAEAIRVGRITVVRERRGDVYRLNDRSFFNSGSARIETRGTADIEELARQLKRELDADPTAEVRVEGHSDARPTHNFIYRSNWELSAARAASVLTILAESAGIDSRRLSVSGYADAVPIADNATEEGRAKNRRVEIVFVRGVRNEGPAR